MEFSVQTLTFSAKNKTIKADQTYILSFSNPCP